MAINEVGFAVVVTSLAIAAVFIPVAFMERGWSVSSSSRFGMTVTAAVVISTIMAVTLSPMLCSRVLTVSKPKENRSWLMRGLTFVFEIPELLLRTAERFYRYALRVAVQARIPLLPRIELSDRLVLARGFRSGYAGW